MICPNCGKENRDGARFCSGCGEAIGAPRQSRMQPQSGTAGQRTASGAQRSAYSSQRTRTSGQRSAAARRRPNRGAAVSNLPAGLTVPGIIILVGSFFMLISPFMAVLKAEFMGVKQSINYFGFFEESSEDGMIFAIMGVIIIVMAILTALLGFRGKRIPCIILPIIGMMPAFLSWVVCMDYADSSWGISLGMSFALTFLGGIAAIVGSIVGLVKHQ